MTSHEKAGTDHFNCILNDVIEKKNLYIAFADLTLGTL